MCIILDHTFCCEVEGEKLQAWKLTWISVGDCSKEKSCVTTHSHDSLHLSCDEVENAAGIQLSYQHLGEAGVRKPRNG